jgi:tetratricopeptide (TPR) repeat protein
LSGKDIKAGSAKIDEARALFEKMHAGGDSGEGVTYGLALALMAPYYAWGPSGGPGSKPNDLQTAANLLRPVAYSATGSRRTKITYADTLNYLSHSMEKKEEGVALCEEARKLLAGLGALDLSDLNATAAYADTTDSQARHTLALGKIDAAERLEREVYDLAEKALAKRPGDLREMNNRYYASDLLGHLAMSRHDYAGALQYATRSAQAAEDVVRFNPSDLTGWGFWINGRNSMADALLEQGKLQQAIDTHRGTVQLAQDPRLPTSLGGLLEDTWGNLAVLQAEFAQFAAANASLEASVKAFDEFAKLMPAGDPRPAVGRARLPLRYARVDLLAGNVENAYKLAVQSVRETEQVVTAADSPAAQYRSNVTQFALGVVSEAALRSGRYAEAEAAARRRMQFPPNPFADDPMEDMSRRRMLLAFAIVKQGRGPEALQVLAPAMDYYKREYAANARGTLFRRDYAEALYVYALAQAGDAAGREARQRALTLAAELNSGASAEARQTVESRELAGWIAAERASAGS